MAKPFKNQIKTMLIRLFDLLPLQRKVVFSSFNGSQCSDSPLALFEEIKKEKSRPVCCIWLCSNSAQKIEGALCVNNSSWKAYYHLATASLWIDNCRKPLWLRKRKGQYYVQTWHGDLCLKKIEKAANHLPKSYIEKAQHDSEMADLFLSGCGWSTRLIQSDFWYDGPILQCGLPRNDVLFQKKEELINQVNEFYGLSAHEKMVLYAPTFRADETLEAYDLDFERLLENLERRWKGKWKLVIRLHPQVQDQMNTLSFNERILNGSLNIDGSALILRSDLFITDYSSMMFEAAKIGKKTILYASDIDAYKMDRGLYFDFDELPFDVCANNEALEQCIRDFDEASYQKKVQAFLAPLEIETAGKACEASLEKIKAETNLF